MKAGFRECRGLLTLVINPRVERYQPPAERSCHWTRMGTQRARSRTPSVEIIVAVSPGAWHEGRFSRVPRVINPRVERYQPPAERSCHWTRMGTQRARSRTPSVEIIVAVSPGAWHEGRFSRVPRVINPRVERYQPPAERSCH